MAQESNDGITYLMALKQANGAAPENAGSSPHADGAFEFRGVNKRRSQRYKCEGSVQIREEKTQVHTWASFTDISLHGCYVEAQATYPAGTVLYLTLEVGSIRVETLGEVRVSYPHFGMGIAFKEMSEENVARLRQMLTAITPAAIMGPGVPSTVPANAPLDAIPDITDPQGAIQALIDFFESRQMLTREDFVRLV
jgi:PilZ domain